LAKSRKEYVAEYLAGASRLGIAVEQPTQVITKTAEFAWDVDSYPLETGDEPAAKSPPRRK
jgi:hypothetical protein